MDYPAPVEAALAEIEPLMPAAPLSPRTLALMAVSGDETLRPWLRQHLDAAALVRVDNVCQRARRAVRPIRWPT